MTGGWEIRAGRLFDNATASLYAFSGGGACALLYYYSLSMAT